VPTFPSPEWLAAYREAINADTGFREAAAGWEGDITLVVGAEPDLGVPFDSWAWFDLHRGENLEAKVVTPDEGERAAFVITAPYSIWKDVLKGRLEPVKGMTQGKLRLSGDLVAIREHVQAVGALVSIAVSITTDFPDE
jgi:putative sterol carrier protein